MNRAILLLPLVLVTAVQQDAPVVGVTAGQLAFMAERIVHTLQPAPDERIVIRFDPETIPSLEPVVRAALERAGARVETWTGQAIDDFDRRLESADVYVWLPGVSRITTSDQSAALRRWVDRGSTRRELHFHWSEGTLNLDRTPAEHTPAFDRVYAQALEIDYAALKTRQDAAIALLRSGEVHVTTPAGTDLRFRVGDRPFNRQDGDGSRRRVERARVRIDRHIELPAGVIRVAPIEESVHGVIVVPTINSGGRRADRIRLELAKGRIQKATAGEGQEALDVMLRDAPALAHFREFGLGFNRALTPSPQSGVIPYYGYGDGIVRLSLGDNEELGGQVRGGAVLWNFVPDATVMVGDRALVTNGRPAPPPVPEASRKVEQTSPGSRPPALVESFDGIGAGLTSTPNFRNPSDNSLAVGPDHVVQTVNSQFAVFSKKGKVHDMTGKVLYGPIATNTVFAGFGGVCEARPNGDAVVRYDQLANRWLVVMPIFRRAVVRKGEAADIRAPAEPGEAARPGQAAQPGKPAPPGPPPPLPPLPPGQRGRGGPPPAQPAQPRGAERGVGAPASDELGGVQGSPPFKQGSYAMCYAVSAGPDPLGPYYRYAFERPLFPDYPRPAVWPDGYYIPTSTGDDVIEKHACVADRSSMLQGLPATEQCVIIGGVNFLNNADIDGTGVPPAGAPNIMMATGGTQLKDDLDDDGIYVWKFHVDWKTRANTRVEGPVKIPVAPYHYLCNGQLTNCVPQPGTDRRLDAQGDKIMARLVYRRIGYRESIVAVHSVNTSAGGGGVRWYEFRLDAQRNVRLHQQGTYAPDGFYRWMASPAIDSRGNIGIGYSFGGTPHFPGQRFAARLADDPRGLLTLRETVLVEGEAAQTNTMRWEDYTQTAIDPSDDCTIWYVGDYYKKDGTNYSTRIGAFRLPGCAGR